jgi:alpha-ketoglutarate-dependent taurine dioxygenase
VVSAVVETDSIPHIVEAPAPGARLDTFLRQRWQHLSGVLDNAGALLFRGFVVDDADSFRAAVAGATPDWVTYDEPSTPRTEVGDRVYTSTEYPADQRIPLHNEMSYRRLWPQHLWLYCARTAPIGGTTTLCDFRRVLRRLAVATRDAFTERGVLYERLYNTGFDMTWQQAFQTDQRTAVEAQLATEGVELSWTDDGGLRTRQVVQGVVTHPRTGRPSWFNQANLFHPSSLDSSVRESLEAALGEENLPRTAKFGDGAQIPEAMLREIRAAIDAETVFPDWADGDVAVVDNLSVAHGREPFQGSRKVYVAMCTPMTSEFTVQNAKGPSDA